VDLHGRPLGPVDVAAAVVVALWRVVLGVLHAVYYISTHSLKGSGNGRNELGVLGGSGVHEIGCIGLEEWLRLLLGWTGHKIDAKNQSTMMMKSCFLLLVTWMMIGLIYTCTPE